MVIAKDRAQAHAGDDHALLGVTRSSLGSVHAHSPCTAHSRGGGNLGVGAAGPAVIALVGSIG